MIAFLVLETLMLGVFCALDLVLFYLFFEAGLIPMFLIIGIWGGKDRIYAAFKFFLYTFLGSVLMLVAMIAMYLDAGTTDIATASDPQLRVRDVQRPGLPGRRRVADAAVPRLLRQLRGEDADVAGAHLAAGCPRAGPDGRVGGAGGDPAEDGRLRLPALQPADVPGGVGRAGAAGVLDDRHRHRLHLAGGAGADGHEEADRLFVGRPHGLCDHGHLRREPAGRRRRDLPDDQPRLHLGRAVPLRRRDLRPDAHARDRRLWRSCEPDAGLCADLHVLHHGQRRPARHHRASSANS